MKKYENNLLQSKYEYNKILFKSNKTKNKSHQVALLEMQTEIMW